MGYAGDGKSLAVMVRHRLEASRPSPASAPQPRVLPFRWGPWTGGRSTGRPGLWSCRDCLSLASLSVKWGEGGFLPRRV